jgi:low affinity Fe/Cu permease
MASAKRKAGKTQAKSESLPAWQPAGPNLHNSKPPLRGFERFARSVALIAGRPPSFLVALGVVLIWMASGPVFHFSDTWQLVINTGTTIVTFLVVFLIQQSQNRDTMALQIKLAELIISVRGAHNALATAEDMSEEELLALHSDFCRKADETLQHIEARRQSGARKAATPTGH